MKNNFLNKFIIRSMNGVFFTIFLFFFHFLFNNSVFAIYDPTSRQNNFFGIHILFTHELEEAERLVNSSGGDWGYVTIPIQANDKDIRKWQAFMDESKRLHLVPILRIATEIDFFDRSVWRKPSYYDIVDFANFLNSLSWPTQNRYIILFNEVNRYDEWGGEKPDPIYYSDIVNFSYDTFKSRSEDFFIIMSGFDNASVTLGEKYVNEFDFLREMKAYDANIFSKIDGFASHSYPNPAFSQPPNSFSKMGVSTYKYEYEYVNSFMDSQKPIFITETGWDNSLIPQEKIGQYYKLSFKDIWEKDKNKIVAITPFLLKSINGPFDIFSFFNKDGKPSSYFDEIKNINKSKGEPLLSQTSLDVNKKILGRSVENVPNFKNSTIGKNYQNGSSKLKIPTLVKSYFKLILGM